MAVSNIELIVNAAKAINPLRKVEQQSKKVEDAVRDMNGRLRDSKGRFIAAGQGANQASRAFNGLTQKVAGLAAAYIGLNAAQNAVRQGIQRIESERRIQFLAKGYGEVEALQNAATKAAQRFGTSQTEANRALADVFARLRPVGVGLNDIVSVYNGFNTAARISGSTAVESANAFRQLSQALGSGALRGDEFNSISEQVPGILTAISKETGVAQGQLRKFAAEGGITADIVIRALKRIETEGAAQLEAALDGPAQAIADFQNAAEDVQVALTKDIVPQMAEVFRGLAELIVNLEGPIRFIGEVAANTLNQINSLITQATQPAATAARRDIEAGLIPTNIVAGLTGGDVRGGAKQLFGEAGLKELEDRAREFAKMRGQGFQETLLQFMQDRLATMDAAASPVVSTLDTPKTFQLNQAEKTGGRPKQIKKEVDMSSELLGLNRQLRTEKELGNEREIATLELMVERQKIAESNLTANTKTNALEEATYNFRRKIFAIDQKAADLAGQERKKREADEKARREADPGFQMQKQLEALLDVQNQVAAGATAIGNAFSNSFKAVITGSKSAQEALADMMSAVAEHFMDMAAKIIAQQIAMIIYGTIMKALGVGGGGFSMSSGATGNFTQVDSNVLGSLGGIPTGYAQGGFVSGPTRALVGEGGEPEYIIPESKMRESMARYSRGARGNSVIPENGGSGTSGEGGGTAVAAPIDVRYTVERINSVDYVTADQFQAGMRQAANQGAKQGEQQTLKRLQMSSGTRKRLGM